MAEFYDISSWNQNLYYQTKGTRDKMVVVNPASGLEYYFKTSIEKYPYEFWSEIIASEVGRYLGFNLLRYDIAYSKGIIGCLSKSMVSENKKLTEGVSYLTGYDNSYNPHVKESYNFYTFQFILEALTFFSLRNKIDELIKVIIFDSLIGNGDRHQENWGFIVETPKPFLRLKGIGLTLSGSFLEMLIVKYLQLKTKVPIDFIKKFIRSMELRGISEFSPIYDSGCCLGREKLDSAVNQMLKNGAELEKYINNGCSEIRWANEKKKISHFELIRRVKEEYEHVVNSTITSVEGIFNEQQLRDLVFSVDSSLPSSLNSFKLPEQRKELIVKMITLRFEKLKELR